MQLLKNNKLLVLLDQILFSGTSFLITLVIARLLNVESFGLFSSFVLIIYLTVGGIAAFVSQPFQVLQSKIIDLNQYVSFAFGFQFISTILIATAAFGITYFINYYCPFFLLVYASGFLMHDFGRRILLAINKPFQTLLLDSLTTISFLIFLYLFSISKTKEIDLLYQYLSFAYGVSFVYLLIVLKPFRLNKNNFLSYWRSHIKEGKWLFLTAILQWWSSNLFVVASGVYLGIAELGALRLAQSLMGILNIIMQTFENYFLPQTAIKMNGSHDEGVAYVADISRKSLLLFLPVLIITFWFSDQIIVLGGGANYASFGFILKGLSILYILIFLSQPIRMLIRALLLNQQFFYGYLISLLFSILFAHGLLSNYGLYGAIIGLGASQFLVIIYWSIILQKRNIRLWKSFISF